MTRRAWVLEWPAVGLWLVIFVAAAAQIADQLFGPSVASVLGLSGKAATIASIVLGLVENIVTVYLLVWVVAWPLGNASCGPLTSIRLMVGNFWRTIGYLIAGILPLMIVHYALGLGAIGRPAWLLWPMLVIDAAVVAMLGLTISASYFVAARHAAKRNGYSLLPAADHQTSLA